MIAPDEKIGIAELESPIKLLAVTIEGRTETTFHEEALQKMFAKINEIIRHINATEGIVVSKADKEILDIAKAESKFAEHLWGEVQKGSDPKTVEAAKKIFEGIDKVAVEVEDSANISMKRKLQEAWEECIKLQKDLEPRLQISFDRDILNKAINKIALKISEVKNEL